MPVNRECRIPRQVTNKFVNGTARERHDRPALRADEVMPVSRLANNVRRVPTGLEQSGNHVHRGENLEGAINRRPSDARQLRHQLLGGEGPCLPENRLDHSPARPSHPIAVTGEDVEGMLKCERLARRNRKMRTHCHKRSTIAARSPQTLPAAWDNR